MSLTYKVFPGTPYYSNTSLTTRAGEIVNTIPAGYVNTTYGTVSIGGTTYYVAYGQMVSFYNSMYSGEQIDGAVTKVRAASATPASGGADLFTTGGAYALQTAITGKADKSDLTDINQTSPTCTETNGIAAGAFFYLDGELVRAKTAIANGAAFTLGTNYEPPTAGALNALKSALAVTDISSLITPYTGVTDLSVNYAVKYGNVVDFSVSATLSNSYGYLANLDASIAPRAEINGYTSYYKAGSSYPTVGLAAIGSGSPGYIYTTTEGQTGRKVYVRATYII